MSITYIIGHKKPDTDSVVAAIALEYLYTQQPCFEYDQPQAAIIDPINPETKFLFDKFEVTAPSIINADDIKDDDQVVLVDHNEASQRLDGLAEEQIVDIIDHHKVNLNLNKPIYLTFKTWGSSCTIAYHLMKRLEVTPTPKLASLMLAAILSDTVGFKGATTDEKDKQYGQELAKIAKIDDIDAFSMEIFKAKSDISSLSDEEIIQNDYKIFEFDQKTFISQLETVEQTALINNKKDQLLSAMSSVKKRQQVELLFVAVTDVLQVNTKLLLAGDQEVTAAQKAFGGTAVNYVLDIGPRMSRKKEIAPLIEEVLKVNN